MNNLTPEEYDGILNDDVFLNNLWQSLDATTKVKALDSVVELKSKWVTYLEDLSNIPF